LDVHLNADTNFEIILAENRNVCAYVYEGSVTNRADSGHAGLASGELGIFGKGDAVSIQACAQGARFLLLAAIPLNEPVVQYGPFVMNTREEIEQAMRDYSAGRLTN